MLLRFPHKSESENVVRVPKLNSLTARQKHGVVCRRCESLCFRYREYIAKNSNVFDVGTFSCAPEMLRFTLHSHEFINAVVTIVM